MQHTPTTDTGYPPAIILKEPGDRVRGLVIGYAEAPARFGDADALVVTISDEQTDQLGSLWLTPTVLRSQFGRLKPKVGELVEVECLGMRQGASREYRDFRVTTPEREPFTPDWNALGDDEGPDGDGA